MSHLHGGLLRLQTPGAHGQRALSSELHDRLSRVYAIAGAVIASVAFIVALLLAAALARPVRALTEMANKLEAGDIDGVIACEVNGSPEHHQLGSTLSRAAHALKREDAVRREIVSAVAHELRTPLVGIRGRIEAAQDGLITDLPKALDAMHADVLRLVRLIEDVERLTQAQQPGLLIARAQVDLADVAAARVAALEQHFTRAGIALDCDLAPVCVNGDPERLGQIIDNLLSNALRYTDAGGSVSVRVRREHRQAALEVEDTGIGIAKEDLDRIFDRFWRGDKSRSRATGGSGIGLALVQELVRGHDGEIEVSSRVGEGTVFRVTLPVATSVDDEPVLRLRSLTHYVTPSDGPLVVTTIDRQTWDGTVGCVEEALRRRIRMGEPVIVLDVDEWPEASESDAIDALTRVHGEARARGGALVVLAESSEVLTRLASAGAHQTIPVVASVDQLVEELTELGLLSSVARTGGLAADDA
jgi:signal transduction histidine kinase